MDQGPEELLLDWSDLEGACQRVVKDCSNVCWLPVSPRDCVDSQDVPGHWDLSLGYSYCFSARRRDGGSVPHRDSLFLGYARLSLLSSSDA